MYFSFGNTSDVFSYTYYIVQPINGMVQRGQRRYRTAGSSTHTPYFPSSFRGETSSDHCNASRLEIELRLSTVVATTRGLPLNRMLVRLLERERIERSRASPDWDECEECEEAEARRWRMRCVGSTSAIWAIRANRERISTIETMPHRLPLPKLEIEGEEDNGKSLSVTKRRWELVARSF